METSYFYIISVSRMYFRKPSSHIASPNSYQNLPHKSLSTITGVCTKVTVRDARSLSLFVKIHAAWHHRNLFQKNRRQHGDGKRDIIAW